MIRKSRNGGGNATLEHAIFIRRTAAIGDVLCSTCVADKLIEQGYDVVYETHPDMHCVLRRHPAILDVRNPGGFVHVDLDGAYEKDPQRRLKHFSSMFMEVANRQLQARNIHLGPPFNCRPVINVRRSDRAAALSKFGNLPRPWVFICPRSDSYNVRQVNDGTWAEAAKRINGTKFWLGRHPAPVQVPALVDLQCRHLDNVINWLSVADLLVSVDTGPLHLGAALGVPIVALGQSSSPELHLSDQRDFVTIEPKGLDDCLNCQQNICRKNQWTPPCQNFDPGFIADWANARLRSLDGEGVSAVVAVYRPDPAVLSKCLECLLPQVDEIVVVRDMAGAFPNVRPQHAKIRYVTKALSDIGYGRKVNFGVRQTNGRYLLFCNDDCYINPGCVDALKKEMQNSVGMVAPLLRYPDGTIYHAGKIRTPGLRGWHHIDHKKYEPTFRQPTEVENSCGACVMVKREAFYKAGAFDEDFYLYAEDDSLALAVRKAGYRIIFTPAATGIHDEHLSTRKTPNIVEIMHKSNALFTKKWAAYLDWNAQRVPLGNFDYCQ